MSALPILISVPHGGLSIPSEVEEMNLLTEAEIAADGDEGARQIYAIENDVAEFVTTEIARAFVDQNRGRDDRRADGVVKTHTCWNVPIYKSPLSAELAETLLDRYHTPYHEALRAKAQGSVRLGLDCHTMAAVAPPIGPDVGERPAACLGNGDGTCPQSWIEDLAEYLSDSFGRSVAINQPFRGGYITRSQPGGIPWIQLELSRAPFLSFDKKRLAVLEGLERWCRKHAA